MQLILYFALHEKSKKRKKIVTSVHFNAKKKLFGVLLDCVLIDTSNSISGSKGLILFPTENFRESL